MKITRAEHCHPPVCEAIGQQRDVLNLMPLSREASLPIRRISRSLCTPYLEGVFLAATMMHFVGHRVEDPSKVIRQDCINEMAVAIALQC